MLGVLLFVIVLSLAGCSEKQPTVSLDDAFYFSGLYHWSMETPFLKDRATGAEYPVVNLKNDPAFQRFLIESAKKRPNFVYVELVGRFVEAGNEGGPDERMLQMDSLLSVTGTQHQRNTETVSGFYVTDEANTRMNLLLNGAYGFRQIRILGDGEETLTGQWRQISRNRIVLFYQEKNGATDEYRKIILFDPDTLQLVEDEGNEQIIYRKEYL